jgi:hypothetical protein
MPYRWLAELVVVAHAAFVVFAVLGGCLVLWRPWVAWLHIPAFAWAVFIEYAGWVCPLTPLENALRVRAGVTPYSGGFVEHYVLRALYPSGLTRGIQLLLGSLVLGVNLAAYAMVLARRRRRF